MLAEAKAPEERKKVSLFQFSYRRLD
jgi:hypothetical protein